MIFAPGQNLETVLITKGDTAIIEVDAFLGNSFRGVVSEIANSAKLALGASPDQVTNFEVKIRMINGSFATLVPDYGENPFRPGMTATVEIITNKMRDALVVPIQAVTVRSDTSSNAVSYERVLSEDVDESFEVVFTPDGMKAGLLVVESGIQDDEFIIVTGVEDSTEVVTGPYSAVSRNLKRGTRITTDKK